MKQQRVDGFSLIEVLVAVLVLAVGVIGTAGMQLAALRTNQQSSFQTTAVQLAAEMADRMRANESQMKLGAARNPYLKVNYWATTHGDPFPPGKRCDADYCNGVELALFDIYEWQKRVYSDLPGGRVMICQDAEPWNSAMQAFTWSCKSGPVDGGSIVIKMGWQEKAPDGTLVRTTGKEFAPGVALTVQPYVP
ncbi:MAG TPA: type IV pilus modification protein PilV [Noviherbaspirillum sp.]|jgi:type IV pilus assembly protein PilV|uniref:type IV pilus modification protein PilV n=1 Tax=Noviherbaspirillum sp. TaxID=1926288 RepID=UPI002DDD0D80|nr:type IV pilus modification protein PilV [Noviherbaspirillum sp.]HEV2609427.1 type IV pilus modification protein PilV [Noviherbaspirillum sp.]